MKEMTEKQKKDIIKKLEERGATSPCPRCGNKSFSIIDGYFRHTIQRDLNSIALGGPGVPVAVIICKNCGFVSEHAVGALGLLPKKDEKNGKK